VTFATLYLAAVAVERLLELSVSRRHEQALVARGYTVAVEPAFAAMVAVHGLVLASAWVEVRALGPSGMGVRLVAGVFFAAATVLRWWVMRTLGERWTVRVVTAPGMLLETGGPFRHLRHPNYLAVLVEVPAVALVCGAWRTALVCGVANALVLRARIALEERALDASAA
jgi:methyltransferase